MNSAGKVILITGASSGIGRATAILTGKTASPVIIAARRSNRLTEVAHEIESAGGKALAIQTDVGDELQVAAMVDKALQQFGRIDVLVNNAGIGLYATVDETTPEQMQKLWRVNYMGTFYAIKHVLPVMRKQQSGQIIVVASMSGRRGAKFKSAYCATKFAQIGFLESLRMELKDTNIKCTLIFPGGTQTEFFEVIENPGQRDVKLYGSVQTAEQVAAEILNAIENPRSEVITQRLGRLQLLLNALSPNLADWLVSRYKK
jgi:NADP-dependent 3-hydroxy acid dehydrogenase YdfG